MTDAAMERQEPLGHSPSDAVVAFGIAEVAFLIERFAETGRDKALEVLRLGDSFIEQPALVAGASSLVARGLAISARRGAELDDAPFTITLAGPAALLGYCLAKAVRWTSIGFFKENEDGDAAFFVQTPTVAVLLQPRAVGTWFALFKTPRGSAAELIELLVKQNTSTSIDQVTAVYLGTSTLTDVRDVFVRPAAATTWTLAEVDHSTSSSTERNLDDDGLRAALEELLTVEA